MSSSRRAWLLPDERRWCPRCQSHQAFRGRFTLTRLAANVFFAVIDPNGDTGVPWRRLRCTRCRLRIWRASRLFHVPDVPAQPAPRV